MNPNTRALFHWNGRASVGGAEREWSLILKAWRRDPTTDAAAEWTYWKREFLAYSSGILDDLPGISAPRLFGAADEGDVAFVWLEEISEQGDHRWPTERYVTAALHFGRFNGAYLAGRPIPNPPFLSRDQLRSWTNWIPWVDIVRSPGSWSHPLAAAALPDPPIERLEHLYSQVGPLFDRMDRQPQTFSHLDAWRSNLIAAHGPHNEVQTIAIDWSSVGTAPAGQELAVLVGGSHIWLDAEPDQLATMSKRAFTAYVDGLRDAGWRGEERDVRFAYAASTALYLAPVIAFWIARIADPARREWVERKCGRPIEEVVRGWAVVLDHALDRAEEGYAIDVR
ncbi:MAG TPA: hypothetical protein VIP07_05220 [Candidatus Limnocylindria bacterium]